MFIKYQHIEKFGIDETDNIEIGKCYVFPKIDGTNSSVWSDGEKIRCGSRNRELSLDNDNGGFMKWVMDSDKFDFMLHQCAFRLFGEWLIPHTLKTYREDAWRQFYVFDVMDENGKYLSYDYYQPIMEEHGINYIPPLRIVNNGSYDTFIKLMDSNDYLIEDGKGLGEGIVIKNYEYQNKYGRQTWAKMVRSEFKEKNYKKMGAPEMNGKSLPEDVIVNDFCSEALIKKCYEKIRVEQDGWKSKCIPELLGRVWHDLIIEECWNFIKKLRNPKINFKTLQVKVIIKVKQILPELF